MGLGSGLGCVIYTVGLSCSLRGANPFPFALVFNSNVNKRFNFKIITVQLEESTNNQLLPDASQARTNEGLVESSDHYSMLSVRAVPELLPLSLKVKPITR